MSSWSEFEVAVVTLPVPLDPVGEVEAINCVRRATLCVVSGENTKSPAVRLVF